MELIIHKLIYLLSPKRPAIHTGHVASGSLHPVVSDKLISRNLHMNTGFLCKGLLCLLCHTAQVCGEILHVVHAVLFCMI